MRTTFKKIRNFEPGKYEWKKLCENLNPEMDMDKEVSILEILESNGVEDAFWALRTQSYRDYCLILADVAESVLHIFEGEYPNDERPRKAIEAIRLWHEGKIADEELKAAADNADYNADYTVGAAEAAEAAYAAYAAAAAGYVAGAAADVVYAAASAWGKQWKKNEEILRKHLEVAR